MRSSLISKTGTLMEWNERAWKDHRVVLAIASGDLSDRTMHPSQVAGGDHPPFSIDKPASSEGLFISAQKH